MHPSQGLVPPEQRTKRGLLLRAQGGQHLGRQCLSLSRLCLLHQVAGSIIMKTNLTQELTGFVMEEQLDRLLALIVAGRQGGGTRCGVSAVSAFDTPGIVGIRLLIRPVHIENFCLLASCVVAVALDQTLCSFPGSSA